MSAITEHIHSCHISVSLSSRKMKAYSSPERSYRRKRITLANIFPLGIHSIKNQKTQCYLMLLQTQIITKTQDRLRLNILHCFPSATGDSQIIRSSRLPLYTNNQKTEFILPVAHIPLMIYTVPNGGMESSAPISYTGSFKV